MQNVFDKKIRTFGTILKERMLEKLLSSRPLGGVLSENRNRFVIFMRRDLDRGRTTAILGSDKPLGKEEAIMDCSEPADMKGMTTQRRRSTMKEHERRRKAMNLFVGEYRREEKTRVKVGLSNINLVKQNLVKVDGGVGNYWGIFINQPTNTNKTIQLKAANHASHQNS
ncbi:hypothetical protein G4B88_011737 [Cannabis sativa]|uniref:Uncharacterized protein n=1 Tax=Cannabis sativa TaxID=3483 RepID=A0A7J6GC05_CANSA|nr:hypothetical protein G4B88_011737 [Cannabis sativa]